MNGFLENIHTGSRSGLPQWGNIDAEIIVPFTENLKDRNSAFPKQNIFYS